MRRRRRRPFGLLLAALLAAPPVARAAEAPASGRRRVAVGVEVVGTLAPEDDGYFNDTDYGYSVLRQLRLRLTGRWEPTARVALVADVRSDDFERPEVQALYVRVRPWTRRAFDVQAGRVPPVFGAFARQRYTADNPVVGYPLAYQYLVALRPDAVPTSSLEVTRMRGRGWLPFYGFGRRDPRAGLPLISALQWDTGVEARVGEGAVQAAVALTQGSLGSPRVRDDNDGKQLSARVAFSPSPSFVVGLSGSTGSWLADTVTSDLAAAGALDGDTHHRQTAWGLDLELSRGYWLARAEVVASEWQVPRLAPPYVRRPLRALGTSLEARYRVAAGLEVGARGDHLGFSRLSDDLDGRSWEAPVWRVEGAVSVSPSRRLRLKAGYQHNWRDGGSVREEGFPVVQASWWF